MTLYIQSDIILKRRELGPSREKLDIHCLEREITSWGTIYYLNMSMVKMNGAYHFKIIW
jgi:hypothetical protein